MTSHALDEARGCVSFFLTKNHHVRRKGVAAGLLFKPEPRSGILEPFWLFVRRVFEARAERGTSSTYINDSSLKVFS